MDHQNSRIPKIQQMREFEKLLNPDIFMSWAMNFLVNIEFKKWSQVSIFQKLASFSNLVQSFKENFNYLPLKKKEVYIPSRNYKSWFPSSNFTSGENNFQTEPKENSFGNDPT